MFIKWVLCKDYISFAEENDLISREDDDNDVQIRLNEFGPNAKEARWTKFIITRSRINNVTRIEDLLYEMRLNRLKKITGPWFKKKHLEPYTETSVLWLSRDEGRFVYVSHII